MNERPNLAADKQGMGGNASNTPYSSVAVETEEVYADDDTAVLVTDIEQTRADMADTLGAIQEKLDPQVLMGTARGAVSDTVEETKEALQETVQTTINEVKQALQETVHQTLQEAKEVAADTISNAQQAATETVHDATSTVKSSVHDATIGKAEQMVSTAGDTAKGMGATIFETIRQNPVPAALAAASIGWLIMKRPSTSGVNQQPYNPVQQRTQYPAYTPRTPTYGTSGQQGGPNLGDTLGQVSNTAGNMAAQASSAVGTMAGQAGSTVGSAVGQAGSTVSDMANMVGSTVGDLSGQVGETVGSLTSQVQVLPQRTQTQIQNMLWQNPLAMGAIAFAAGAALGFTMPETPAEDRLLGQARDQVMSKVQERALDTVNKVQNVAQEVQQTVQQGAQGLTGGSSDAQ